MSQPPTPRRSIRKRLVTLTVVPSTALLMLWGLATTALISDMLNLRANARFIEGVGSPALDVIGALQTERRFVMERLGDPEAQFSSVDTFDFTSADGDPVEQIQGETDTAIEDFRATLADTSLSRLSEEARDRVWQFDEALNDLVAHRGALSGDIERAEAVQPYNDTIESGLQIWDATAELGDASLAYRAHSLTSLIRGRELLSQEDALLSYALADNSFTPEDHAEFAHTVGAQRFLYTQLAPELSPEERAIYDGVIATNIYRIVRDLEDEVVAAVPASTTTPPIRNQPWKVAQGSLDIQFQRVEDNRTAALISDSRSAANTLLAGVASGSIIALVVVAAAALYSMRVTRGVSDRLRTLSESTLDHAQRRLPSVTQRLRAGETVDVDTEAPELPVGERDEIGEATEAFNLAQRAAVRSAVEEARLRNGVRSIFRNIARRTQTLVHRQLGVLDTLEQTETDPEALGSLFRVDHLGTQMRRNADNLILLSGARPGRRHREPLLLLDAVRAACSEIQDYQRVKVLPIPHVALSGQTAGDVIHLLAELLDNATGFSPPHTPVTVRGEMLAHGYAVEIEDRGLGMSQERYAELNQLLSSLPDFDLTSMREDSSLGLYVVATIANRCGIQITLRPSPYNGTQAIVVLPTTLVQQPDASLPDGSTSTAREVLGASAAASDGERGRGSVLTAPQTRSLPAAVPGEQRPAEDPLPDPSGPPATAVTPSRPATSGPSSPAPSSPPSTSPSGSPPSVTESAPTASHSEGAPPRPPSGRSTGSEEGSETYKGLPRRRRTRHSADRPPSSNSGRSGPGGRTKRGDVRDALGMHAAPSGVHHGQPAEAPAERPLHEIRQMMSSYQLGTRRGRVPGDQSGQEGDNSNPMDDR